MAMEVLLWLATIHMNKAVPNTNAAINCRVKLSL